MARLPLARRRSRGSRTINPNDTRQGQSLTASGDKVRQKDAQVIRRLYQNWQARSFTYYDLLGEVKFAAQFYARGLQPLDLYCAVQDDNGEWVEDDDPESRALLDRIQDPGGGRSGLLGTYGRLMFLVGEALLMVSQDPDTGDEQWEMLSPDELRIQGGNYVRYRAPSLAAEDFKEPSDKDFAPIDENHAVVYRLWRRHPRFSQLADSTMQGVLELCEELVLLTQAVRARARSRLAGPGVLFIDGRISPPPLEAVGDEDAKEDPFVADLVAAAMAPMKNEGSASAVVPLVVRVEVPEGMKLADLVYHLQIIDPAQFYPETGLRKECIERIALGLDMPPEILLGLGDANHWSAWMVDEQVWKGHLQAVAEQLVDDLTSGYYRPALREAGVEDWRRRAIKYDATRVINHPDREKGARECYDRGAIGLRALRTAYGFGDDAAATEQDRAERIGIACRDSSLAWYGIPSVKAGGIEPAAGEIVSGQGEASAPAGPVTGAEVEPAPPSADEASEPSGPTSVVGGGNGNGAAVVLGATHAAFVRAREAAGNRVLSLANKNPEMRVLVRGVPTTSVPATLGPERLRELGCPATGQLVAGARVVIAETLELMGITDELLATTIAAEVEKHAARTLFETKPPPLPPALTTYLTHRVATLA